VLSSAVSYFGEGQRNADPSFPITQLDLCCIGLWLMAIVGVLLILKLTRRSTRVVSGIVLATCVLAIAPLQCERRQIPLDRYEAGFFQWALGHVPHAPIVAWQGTLQPVTAPKNVPPAAWPSAIASLKPSNVIQLPSGIIIEWGMVGAWGNSGRVFIAANATVLPPTNDENALFNWKTLGPGFFAAYQTTD
jgi:hypothetical protein